MSQLPESMVTARRPTPALMSRATSRRASPRAPCGVGRAVRRRVAGGAQRRHRRRARSSVAGPGPRVGGGAGVEGARGPWSSGARSVASQAPPRLKLSTVRMASSTVGPDHRAGAIVAPRARWTRTGPGWCGPTMRSSQPVRSEDPGRPRSISSMSVKCERVGLGWPTAWTTARPGGEERAAAARAPGAGRTSRRA